ncbi:hypothetical protein BegalDRAFT_2966 [Beggiatoa alba B18LD]|uniref:Uncharacterized protein n=1 Tax=Beggiatoa alba B18LD TaxID=395493 RepID=I3CJK1_9GAMM|nr:DUF3226 domain-containing protein [Beggiatoa alba]EIJ43794.1 hypothetical protein BegalDRAFT_2966 [Beggiatoa alba B18LD]
MEDKNDQFTFEALIKDWQLNDNLEIKSTDDIDWQSTPKESNPEKPTALINALKNRISEFSKGKYDRVGIINDIDQSKSEDLLATINNALKIAYPNEYKKISQPNELVSFSFENTSTEEVYEVSFACYFVHLNQCGEIENLLKTAKEKDSELADCIHQCSKECLEQLRKEDLKLKDKDLVKLWINNYIRYDTLPKKDRNAKNTTWETVMKERQPKEQLFNFNHDVFKELKAFLTLMVKKEK